MCYIVVFFYSIGVLFRVTDGIYTTINLPPTYTLDSDLDRGLETNILGSDIRFWTSRVSTSLIETSVLDSLVPSSPAPDLCKGGGLLEAGR